MYKRSREETLEGTSLTGDALFADKQRLIHVLNQVDYRALSAFERTSGRARQFVQRNQIWRTLFQKVYPSVFNNAVIPNQHNMKFIIKDKIDTYTVDARQNRGETYWKRYFEYLVKTTQAIESTGNREYPVGWSEGKTLNIWGLLEDDVFRQGFVLDIMREPATDIIFMYQRDDDDDWHSTHMLRMDINTLTATVVPWFVEVFAYTPVHMTELTRSNAFSSLDGFIWCLFSAYSISQVIPNKNMLVSCSICNVVEANLCVCACCGKECQQINH